MQKTWLVHINNTKYQIINEYYYYCLYFINFISFFTNSRDYFKNLFKLSLLFKYTSSHSNIFTKYTKPLPYRLDKFTYLKPSSVFKNIEYGKILSSSNKPSRTIVNQSVSKNKVFFFFMNLFFLLNHSSIDPQFPYFHNLHLMNVTVISSNILLTDTKKFFKRWHNAYTVLFNVFFYNFSPTVFGTPFFKNEILSLNWHYSNLDTNTWKYTFPFFVYKLNNFNRKIEFFFNKLQEANVNLYFITDCFYHFKLLHYFNKQKLYTLGLVSSNLNPWLVSYPLPVLSNNLFLQFFFLKLLVLSQKYALFYKFSFFKKNWNNLILFNKVKYLINS